MEYNKPQIITFDKIGSSQLGYITITETQKNVPFEIQCVYYTHHDVKRCGHAHKTLQQMIFAVSGTIIFNT